MNELVNIKVFCEVVRQHIYQLSLVGYVFNVYLMLIFDVLVSENVTWHSFHDLANFTL